METTLRSRPARLLIAAALMCSLALGVGFVVAHRSYDLRGIAQAEPMSDDQSRRQVLDPARQFIDAGSLRVETATYVLMSCSAEDGPPYRGRVYLTFEVPTVAKTRAVFADLARAMSSRGWRVGTRPGRHPEGWKLAKNGVLAVYYRSPDVPNRAVLQIDGECRNPTDHQADTTGFVDVTGDLNR
jgi:hypothetical protein